MAFQFRFPAAISHMIKQDPECPRTRANAVEKAREWALPLMGEKKQRPALTETDEWIGELLEAEKTIVSEAYTD